MRVRCARVDPLMLTSPLLSLSLSLCPDSLLESAGTDGFPHRGENLLLLVIALLVLLLVTLSVLFAVSSYKMRRRMGVLSVLPNLPIRHPPPPPPTFPRIGDRADPTTPATRQPPVLQRHWHVCASVSSNQRCR
ncbi:hypothetical protein chiPu_0028786 [Chiloscyllium punctatum]|uniref:Uncharacterized protein n=1 Tax=Chiloscyllium punctatum TaxID=137246 RepID=A0A401TQA1_CHIPU|nr:hypothetical protein [Chiloscyllium punctatum]